MPTFHDYAHMEMSSSGLQHIKAIEISYRDTTKINELIICQEKHSLWT
jgi:hypothetical protein